MKIQLYFKTPDVVDQALNGLDINEDERAEIKDFISQYVQYQECVTLEFDTTTQTATVLPR